MASGPSEVASPAPVVGGGGRGTGGEGAVHHARSFKLQFAMQREPGRSDVSPLRPMGLPAIVTDKFYNGARGRAEAEVAAEAAALARVQDMFRRRPRDQYSFPKLTSHEVGWWSEYARRDPLALRHHIRDSWWLRERLRLLPPTPHRDRR